MLSPYTKSDAYLFLCVYQFFNENMQYFDFCDISRNRRFKRFYKDTKLNLTNAQNEGSL